MARPTRVGLSSRVYLLIGATAMALLALPFLGSAQAPPPTASRPDRSPIDYRREFQDRHKRLRPDDIEGHYALAEWCSQNRLYRELLRQAQYVLQLEPGHENAQLLYGVAVERLRAQNAQTGPEGDGEEESDGEFLTARQIQRLKFAEFLEPDQLRPELPNAGRRDRGAIREEFLQVRFSGDVLNELLDRMSGHQDFDSREERTQFLSLSPTLQTQLIRQHTGTTYQDRIEIRNDPLVFRQFERVLPMVLSGCATSRCHGGADAEGWRLRTGRPKTSLNLYTNFLILTRAHRGSNRLVNRPKPEDSLLLQYGLPPQQATFQHPETIPVIFPRGVNDLRYQTILAWIENLRIPEPTSGVALPGYPEPPPPQFGGIGKPPENREPNAQ